MSTSQASSKIHSDSHTMIASEFILRIQTDGTIAPRAALMQACQELITDLGILSREFTKEWELRKMVGDGAKADDRNGDRR